MKYIIQVAIAILLSIIYGIGWGLFSLVLTSLVIVCLDRPTSVEIHGTLDPCYYGIFTWFLSCGNPWFGFFGTVFYLIIDTVIEDVGPYWNRYWGTR